MYMNFLNNLITRPVYNRYHIKIFDTFQGSVY